MSFYFLKNTNSVSGLGARWESVTQKTSKDDLFFTNKKIDLNKINKDNTTKNLFYRFVLKLNHGDLKALLWEHRDNPKLIASIINNLYKYCTTKNFTQKKMLDVFRYNVGRAIQDIGVHEKQNNETPEKMESSVLKLIESSSLKKLLVYTPEEFKSDYSKGTPKTDTYLKDRLSIAYPIDSEGSEIAPSDDKVVYSKKLVTEKADKSNSFDDIPKHVNIVIPAVPYDFFAIFTSNPNSSNYWGNLLMDPTPENNINNPNKWDGPQPKPGSGFRFNEWYIKSKTDEKNVASKKGVYINLEWFVKNVLKSEYSDVDKLIKKLKTENDVPVHYETKNAVTRIKYDSKGKPYKVFIVPNFSFVDGMVKLYNRLSKDPDGADSIELSFLEDILNADKSDIDPSKLKDKLNDPDHGKDYYLLLANLIFRAASEGIGAVAKTKPNVSKISTFESTFIEGDKGNFVGYKDLSSRLSSLPITATPKEIEKLEESIKNTRKHLNTVIVNSADNIYRPLDKTLSKKLLVLMSELEKTFEFKKRVIGAEKEIREKMIIIDQNIANHSAQQQEAGNKIAYLMSSPAEMGLIKTEKGYEPIQNIYQTYLKEKGVSESKKTFTDFLSEKKISANSIFAKNYIIYLLQKEVKATVGYQSVENGEKQNFTLIEQNEIDQVTGLLTGNIQKNTPASTLYQLTKLQEVFSKAQKFDSQVAKELTPEKIEKSITDDLDEKNGKKDRLQSGVKNLIDTFVMKSNYMEEIVPSAPQEKGVVGHKKDLSHIAGMSGKQKDYVTNFVLGLSTYLRTQLIGVRDDISKGNQVKYLDKVRASVATNLLKLTLGNIGTTVQSVGNLENKEAERALETDQALTEILYAVEIEKTKNYAGLEKAIANLPEELKTTVKKYLSNENISNLKNDLEVRKHLLSYDQRKKITEKIYLTSDFLVQKEIEIKAEESTAESKNKAEKHERMRLIRDKAALIVQQTVEEIEAREAKAKLNPKIGGLDGEYSQTHREEAKNKLAIDHAKKTLKNSDTFPEAYQTYLDRLQKTTELRDELSKIDPASKDYETKYNEYKQSLVNLKTELEEIKKKFNWNFTVEGYFKAQSRTTVTQTDKLEDHKENYSNTNAVIDKNAKKVILYLEKQFEIEKQEFSKICDQFYYRQYHREAIKEIDQIKSNASKFALIHQYYQINSGEKVTKGYNDDLETVGSAPVANGLIPGIKDDIKDLSELSKLQDEALQKEAELDEALQLLVLIKQKTDSWPSTQKDEITRELSKQQSAIDSLKEELKKKKDEITLKANSVTQRISKKDEQASNLIEEEVHIIKDRSIYESFMQPHMYLLEGGGSYDKQAVLGERVQIGAGEMALKLTFGKVPGIFDVRFKIGSLTQDLSDYKAAADPIYQGTTTITKDAEVKKQLTSGRAIDASFGWQTYNVNNLVKRLGARVSYSDRQFKINKEFDVNRRETDDVTVSLGAVGVNIPNTMKFGTNFDITLNGVPPYTPNTLSPTLTISSAATPPAAAQSVTIPLTYAGATTIPANTTNFAKPDFFGGPASIDYTLTFTLPYYDENGTLQTYVGTQIYRADATAGGDPDINYVSGAVTPPTVTSTTPGERVRIKTKATTEYQTSELAFDFDTSLEMPIDKKIFQLMIDTSMGIARRTEDISTKLDFKNGDAVRGQNGSINMTEQETKDYLIANGLLPKDSSTAVVTAYVKAFTTFRKEFGRLSAALKPGGELALDSKQRGIVKLHLGGELGYDLDKAGKHRLILSILYIQTLSQLKQELRNNASSEAQEITSRIDYIFDDKKSRGLFSWFNAYISYTHRATNYRAFNEDYIGQNTNTVNATQDNELRTGVRTKLSEGVVLGAEAYANLSTRNQSNNNSYGISVSAGYAFDTESEKISDYLKSIEELSGIRIGYSFKSGNGYKIKMYPGNRDRLIKWFSEKSNQEKKTGLFGKFGNNLHDWVKAITEDGRIPDMSIKQFFNDLEKELKTMQENTENKKNS